MCYFLWDLSHPVLRFVLDILSDLPELPKLSARTSNISSNASETTDYESAHSRLSSVESLLSGDASFGSSSPVDLPDMSHEEDDDVWLNKFGKEPVVEKSAVTKTRSSSNTEMKSDFTDMYSYPTRKKKNSSFGRLETTTYSFSLGNSSHNDEVPHVVKIFATMDSSQVAEIEPPVWVKRDSKERVPVRKHLKTVHIKATINASGLQSIATTYNKEEQSSPRALKVTPFVLTDSKKPTIKPVPVTMDSGIDESTHNQQSSPTPTNSEKDNQLLLHFGSVSKQLHEVPDDVADAAKPSSPTKQGPLVLPKPKKTLDKKSWTADLIKSKSHPEQPIPGSLNDRLLNRRKYEPLEENKVSRTPSVNNRSVKEILTKFQTTPSLNNLEDQVINNGHSASGREKYV